MAGRPEHWPRNGNSIAITTTQHPPRRTGSSTLRYVQLVSSSHNLSHCMYSVQRLRFHPRSIQVLTDPIPTDLKSPRLLALRGLGQGLSPRQRLWVKVRSLTETD
jgi:hypothetical protein